MVQNERNGRIDFIEESSKPLKDLCLSFHVLELSVQLNTVQLSGAGKKRAQRGTGRKKQIQVVPRDPQRGPGCRTKDQLAEVGDKRPEGPKRVSWRARGLLWV